MKILSYNLLFFFIIGIFPILSHAHFPFKKNEFYFPEIKWKVSMPEGYTLKPNTDAQQSIENGNKKLNEANNKNFVASKTKLLLNYKKDVYNNFSSSYLIVEKGFDLKSHLKKATAEIINTLKKDSISADTFATSMVVAGKSFEYTQYRLTNIRTNSEFLIQLLFSALIDDKLLEVTFCTNNKKELDLMFECFTTSTFE